jgi:acetyl-CoA C-acetyltransferase
VAAINAGIPKETPAYNVNRLCGSGLQAIICAAQSILLGDVEIAVSAGAESMSRGPYILASQRWGARLGNSETLDYTLGILHDPFARTHMGITAENVAQRYEISRTMQDELAFRNQQRAADAIKSGRFKSQILPFNLLTRKGESVFDVDEHVRADTTMSALAQLKPAFIENGAITAGNSSGINDGAAAIVLASGEAIRQFNLSPMARLVSYAHAGIEPAYMGIGPVPATKIALARARIKPSALGVIEANEAFAAQACAVIRELDLDQEKVNPNGSGISLGHSVGATGVIITTKALYEMNRVHARYALATMCIGGGQGIAAIFERA